MYHLMTEKCTTRYGKMYHSQPKNVPVDIDQLERFPLLTTTRHFPLGLNERSVYSYLAFRGRVGRGESLRTISAATTIHRQTVIDSLEALGELVEKRNGRRWAVEPTSDQSDWFAIRKTNHGKHWTDRFASIKLFVPEKGAKVGKRRFTLNHAVLYAELYSFSRKKRLLRTTLAGLSKLMNGVDETTIRSGLDLLQAADLIQVIRHGRWFEVKVEPLTEKSIAMFASSETNNHPEAPEPIGFSDPVHETILALCRQHKIPSGLAAEITRLYSQLPHPALPDFQDMLNCAEHDHVNNRVRGRYNVPHCGFLLRHVLRDIIAAAGATPLVSAVAPLTIDELQQREAELIAATRKSKPIRCMPSSSLTISPFGIGYRSVSVRSGKLKIRFTDILPGMRNPRPPITRMSFACPEICTRRL